ncbi:MAG: hypothetical protein ABL908_22785, partial [Hyphomicrobium sp.]
MTAQHTTTGTLDSSRRSAARLRIPLRARTAAAVLAALAAVLAPLAATPASAAPCTAEDFAAAVDEAGARLRAFNADAGPKLQDGL